MSLLSVPIFLSTSEVTMQVSYIAKALLNIKSIYIWITNMCLYWVSTFFGTICWLFFKLLQGFNPYITFYLRCKCSTFWGARTHPNVMKHCIDLLMLWKEGTFMKNEIFTNTMQVQTYIYMEDNKVLSICRQCSTVKACTKEAVPNFYGKL